MHDGDAAAHEIILFDAAELTPWVGQGGDRT